MTETRTPTCSTVQTSPATPVQLYTSTSARCWCDRTIMLRTDGLWTHGAALGGVICREPVK